MKNIIWLSPSLAAGAIAARLVVFFKRRPQGSPRRGLELTARSCPAGFQTRTRVLLHRGLSSRSAETQKNP
jgi:hypothetical protein